MLILSRRIGEYMDIIVGGKTMSFKIKEITGRQTKIAFFAPDEFKILRREVNPDRDNLEDSFEMGGNHE